MSAYYNEFDPYAAQWLRNLISAGHIALGEVDERSIVDVRADELRGFVQCHFFAGIGGWSLAARMAGWPDTRPLWTGSCPCQPFSVAGKQEGQADERHLWPVFFELIGANRPDVVMGEQVAAAIGKDWLDGVHFDLESIGYACGATVVPACAVDAPHRRDRLWFVADRDLCEPGQIGRDVAEMRGLSEAERWPEHGSSVPLRGGEAWGGNVADASHQRIDRGGSTGPSRRDEYPNGSSVCYVADADSQRLQGLGSDSDPGRREGQDMGPYGLRDRTGAWSDHGWAIGSDGKARRVKSGLRLLAHGVPARVGKLRAYGNAIVPALAAEIIAAYMECRP